MKNRKNNKGFSLVELIVVIAIMAVLVGVLAPQFIKYVNSSKISTDVKNGQEIASCISVAMTDANSGAAWQVKSGTGASPEIVEISSVPGLASMPAIKTTAGDEKWYAKWNPADGTVEVYCSGNDDDHMVYPTDKYTGTMD